jgi:long-chain acyl-CoA synthetase
MIGPLQRAVRLAADRLAVACDDLTLTYGEVWDRCRRLVAGLHGLGLSAGDRVAVIGPNCHRYLELYQAVPGAGMVLVPLNVRHAAAELRYALEDSGTRVVLAGRPVEDLPACVEHVFDLGAGYEDLLAGAAPATFPADLDEDTLAGLFYTGGTTGAAKGVMLTHRNLVANALHFQACARFRADTRFLLAAPMFHAAGTIALLATVWNAGCHVVLPAFEPAPRST